MTRMFPLLAEALALVLALAACAGGGPAAQAPAGSDPVLQGHASWCGSQPASGYCTTPEKK